MAAVGTAWLILAFLVAVIEGCAFDPDYYEREYRKNDAAAYVGVTQQTLDEATAVLLEYLQGKRPDLEYEAEIGGVVRSYYNEREKLHMADVRILNERAVLFMRLGFIFGGALTAGAFLISREKYRVFGACFCAVAAVLAAFIALGLWAAVDFSGFWVQFHHVFFSNDLWLFDPRQSLLIRMFELQFFFDLVTWILVWFLSVTAAVLIVTGTAYQRGKRHAKEVAR